jgi:hypothetical protein
VGSRAVHDRLRRRFAVLFPWLSVTAHAVPSRFDHDQAGCCQRRRAAAAPYHHAGQASTSPRTATEQCSTRSSDYVPVTEFRQRSNRPTSSTTTPYGPSLTLVVMLERLVRAAMRVHWLPFPDARARGSDLDLLVVRLATSTPPKGLVIIEAWRWPMGRPVGARHPEAGLSDYCG